MHVFRSCLTIEDETIPCEKHRFYVDYNIHNDSIHIQHTMNYTNEKEGQSPQTFRDIDIDAEGIELGDLLEMQGIQDWMYAGVGDVIKDQLMATRVSELHMLGTLTIFVI